MQVWRCDAVHYAQARGELEARCQGFEDAVPPTPGIDLPRAQLRALRPDQQAAVTAWSKSGRGVVVMPTGTGKTEIGLSIIAQCAVTTLIVAPVRDLMHQWHRRIAAALGYEAGILGDGVHDVRPITVTTYDSACIYMERLGDRFGLVIFDECHYLPGPVRADAARMSTARFRLGLTSTPKPPGQSGLGIESLIGPIAYELPISQARGRTIADYDVIRIPVHLTDQEQYRYDRLCREIRSVVLEGQRTGKRLATHVSGRTHVSDPAAWRFLKAIRQKQAIEDRAAGKVRVLEDLFRLHAGEAMLVFAGSNAMARDISLRFLIPCLLNHCGRQERLEVLTGLQQGTYPAVVANRVLDEGIDLPDVKIAVVVGGSADGRQAKQRLGRVLRKSGSLRAVLYEVVCEETSELKRSRSRRRSDAFAGRQRRQRIGLQTG